MLDDSKKAVSKKKPADGKKQPPPKKPKKAPAKTEKQEPVQEDEFAKINEYLQWTQDNLQVPTTIDEIQKLYDMSREGTLMAIDPGWGFNGMRQVYTDEQGNISVSVQVDDLVDESQNVPDEYKMPAQPGDMPEIPEPEQFGVEPPPKAPVAPKNMKPGFWAWLGSVLGIYTSFDEKLEYEEAMEQYKTDYKKWKEEMGPNHKKYEEAVKKAREDQAAYLKEVEEYLAKPLGKLYAIKTGIAFSVIDETNREKVGKDGRNPSYRFRTKEIEFMREQHAKLPQGKTYEALEEARKILGYAKRTKKVVANLLGHDAAPDELTEWKGKKVFKGFTYNLKKHELPKLANPSTATYERRKEFGNIWKNLFQVAGFAALSHPDIIGQELNDEPTYKALNPEENAKLNFGGILQDIITTGRGNSDPYMKYLEPAREKANAAIHAYYNGELGPMADLLRSAIRKSNKEVTDLSVLHADHAMNTLYLVGRMWEVLEADPELKAEVGLTAEEIEETKGNVAMHAVMTKGFEAKEKLLMHALYKHTLPAEELQEYACDLMLAQQVEKEVFLQNKNDADAFAETKEFEELEALTMQGEEGIKKANRYMQMIKHPPFEIAKNLLKENWIENAKKALRENCGFEKLATMTPDEIGSAVFSATGFENTFQKQQPKPQNTDMVKNKELANEKENANEKQEIVRT